MAAFLWILVIFNTLGAFFSILGALTGGHYRVAARFVEDPSSLPPQAIHHGPKFQMVIATQCVAFVLVSLYAVWNWI